MASLPSPLLCLALAWALVPIAAWSDSGRDPHLDPDASAKGYVGAAACGTCHETELGLWRGSHHDLAMAAATEETVLGDFDDVRISVHGVESRFFRHDGGFYVHTDGPDGELRDYPIRWTFGWYPLQQYLIDLPGGRLQALGLAWDSRPADAGGQRWFHLYPNERMDAKHPLHWTARDQTWNYQCADCHSTDLQKGYDPARDRYDTRYAEIDVACEACHGPGARHIAWAEAQATGGSDRDQDVDPGGGSNAPETGTAAVERDRAAPPPDDPAKGLWVNLRDRDGGAWQIDPATGKPYRTVPRTSDGQLNVCAPCHSRRGRIWAETVPGESLHQGYRLALLTPELYFPDGQIRDEVYVYGSFVQSRMYAQGVVCSDCHEPHSLRLRAEGNGVCARCHAADRYDAPTHHRHAEGSTGAACVACHMPQRLYMVVDERADHSLRVPRPDLSVRLGTPNACNDCHTDKDAAWAAAAVAEWFPESAYRGPHFGEALHSADTGAPDARTRLLALAEDRSQPAIARASALDRLRALPDGEVLEAARRLLGDPDPLVRSQSVRFLENVDLRTRVELAWPLLDDPIRIVRIEATRVLAPVLTQEMGDALKDRLSAALEEYVAAEGVNADRPEAHLNLGLVALAAGETRVAEKAYRTALGLDPGFVPAYVNLADLYRQQGREWDALAELKTGLAAVPLDARERADLHHAMGLALVRVKRLDSALEELHRAADMAPERVRYAFVYAVALDGAERTADALPVLEHAYRRAPNDPELLAALVRYNAKLGRREAADAWLDKLATLIPGDPALDALRAEIQGSSDARQGP